MKSDCKNCLLDWNNFQPEFKQIAEVSSIILRGLAHILGFQDEIVLTRDSDLYPKRGVDLNHGVRALFIYVDVIIHQNVGNAEVPLLRTVRRKSFTGGDRPEMETVIFTQPHYVPVSKQYVEGVEVDIKDGTGENL